METRELLEAAKMLEEAVCESEARELHILQSDESGRSWIEVADRRFLSEVYLRAANALASRETFEEQPSIDSRRKTFKLGHHSCARVSAGSR